MERLMLSDQQLHPYRGRFMVIQIVAFALMMGALVFTGIISQMVNWEVIGNPPKIFNVLGAATAFLMYAISFGATLLFPRLPTDVASPQNSTDEVDESVQKSAIEAILKLMTTEYVVRYAIMEGGVFLNAMVLMLEPRWITVVAIGVGVLLMILRFPLKLRTLPQLCQRYEEWHRG